MSRKRHGPDHILVVRAVFVMGEEVQLSREPQLWAGAERGPACRRPGW